MENSLQGRRLGKGPFISCQSLEAGLPGAQAQIAVLGFYGSAEGTTVGLRRRAVDVALPASFTAGVCVTPEPAAVDGALGLSRALPFAVGAAVSASPRSFASRSP